MVAHVTSLSNGCSYCSAHTFKNGADNGVPQGKLADIWSFETSDLFSDAERAALRIALTGGQCPSYATQDDMAEMRRHFSEAQIVEIGAVIALFSFNNRWNALNETDITLSDGTVLPSIATILPESRKILPVGATYNFMMRRDLPPEIMQELADGLREAANSEGFKALMDQKFFQLDVKIGEDADREGALMEVITVDIFNKFQDQIGVEVKTAEELGLPKPEDFDGRWPPEGYKPAPIK